MTSDATEFHTLSRALADAIPKVIGGPAWHGDSQRWNRYLEQHEAGERWAIVATINGNPVGYGGLRVHSQYELFRLRGIPEITDLVVAETFRKRGIATGMISRLEKHAVDAGYKTIGLGVGLYPDYGAAQRLYTQLGYVFDGKGMTYKCIPVHGGNMVRADDDLCLWMEKTL